PQFTSMRPRSHILRIIAVQISWGSDWDRLKSRAKSNFVVSALEQVHRSGFQCFHAVLSKLACLSLPPCEGFWVKGFRLLSKFEALKEAPTAVVGVRRRVPAVAGREHSTRSTSRGRRTVAGATRPPNSTGTSRR